MRVYDFARRYKLSSRGLIELLRGIGIHVDHHMCGLDEQQVAAARKLMQRVQRRQEPLVFLCYSTKDLGFMRRLRTSLETAGFTVWTAEGIKPGTQSWVRAIREAIKRSRAVVAILSKNAEQSNWVGVEIHFALLRKKPLIPVLAKDDHTEATPLEIVTFQWIDARGKEYPRGARRLIEALRDQDVTPTGG